MEEKGFELKYAPGKCPYFTMGDCMILNYDKSCGIDCDKCDIYNLYKQLQLKDKMIELMAKDKIRYLINCKGFPETYLTKAEKDNFKCITKYYKEQALVELEG